MYFRSILGFFSGVGFALRGQFSQYTKSQPFKGVRALRVAVCLGWFQIELVNRTIKIMDDDS